MNKNEAKNNKKKDKMNNTGQTSVHKHIKEKKWH